MKLEVGMYVRTKHNGIKKINGLYSKAIFTDTYIRIENKDISKASHNIIDLIEVGDYVNGHQVYDIGIDEIKYLDLDVCGEIHFPSETFVNDGDIKSIVTKEQFESMSYRVGSEE